MRAAGRQTEDRVGVFSRGPNAGDSPGIRLQGDGYAPRYVRRAGRCSAADRKCRGASDTDRLRATRRERGQRHAEDLCRGRARRRGGRRRLPQLRALSSGCQTDEALTTRAFPSSFITPLFLSLFLFRKQKTMQLAAHVHLTSRPGTLRFLGFGIFGDREGLYFGNGSTTTKHT